VLEVRHINERIAVLRVSVGRSVQNLLGRTMAEKEEFLISLGKVLSSLDAGERLVVCGDM